MQNKSGVFTPLYFLNEFIIIIKETRTINIE